MSVVPGISPSEAIKNKKHVVTANKALLAVHGEEIYTAAEKAGVTVGYEASVAGGIPILKSLREGLAANRIESIYGIVNGTCNYILTLMTNEGRKFDEVLKEAQAKGYAESDPTFDIEGTRFAHKLAVLTMLAFGTPVKFEDIYTEGISKIAARHRICEGARVQDQAPCHHQDGKWRGRGAGSPDHAAGRVPHRHGGRCVQWNVQRVARDHLHPSRLSIVLVGDASVIAPQLKRAGFGDFEVITPDELDLTAANFRRAP